MSADILRFFAGLTSLFSRSTVSLRTPVTFNCPGAAEPWGHAFRIEVMIAEDGEIMVKGPNVFKGYYKDEAATNDAPQTAGCTWDLGEFDEDGYLSITGRKKDIITRLRQEHRPEDIESALKSHDVVGEAVVIGDRRSCLL